MARTWNIALVLAGLAAGAAQVQAATPPGTFAPGPQAAATTAPSPALQKLMASEQRLRDAITLMQGKAPGPERDLAIARARAALAQTQQAMVDLPPQPAASGAVPTAGYDTSVRALMAASDALRDAIHTIARQPAGEARVQAIRDANRALLDTQVAMANAYDVTAFPPKTATMGAGATPQGSVTIRVDRENCVRLGTMWGCR